MSEPLVARRVIVRGTVQGVGYRYSAIRQAAGLPVAGWVRNASDGSVEAHVEGPAWAVDELLAWMAEGPPGGSVTSVDATDVMPEGHKGFTIAR